MSRIKDITGQRFGKLTTVRPTEKRSGTSIVWECICDCGSTKLVAGHSLVNGRTQSCGCIRVNNLTGQRFGKLVAIRPTDERRHGSIVWECQCDCGNTAFVDASRLQSGQTKSCGCARTIDLTGQRFGRLIVVRAIDQRRGRNIVWECKCDCGNTVFVITKNLCNGSTQSCGCISTKDLTGQRFGKLVAIRPTDERRHRKVVWECKCDCGNTALVSSGSLQSGNTQSCGCLRREKMSKNKE